MRLIRRLAPVFPLVLITACGNPANNVPRAAVSSETNTDAAASAPASGDRVFTLSGKDSQIHFIGSKVTGSHNGGFTNFTGEFRVASGRLAGAGNKIVIDMNSIWADNAKLTGHLKTPDFFNVAQFPNAEFVSTAVEKKTTNYMVSGNLTLHGVTRQISFPADIQVSDDAVTVKSQFVLNRFDFDIKYAGKADDLIRKEVVIRLNIRGTPGKPSLARL